MSNREKKTFTYKELAEILVKHAGIKVGHWGIYAEFGLAAANVPIGDKSGEVAVRPAAVVSVNTVGILRFDEPNPLTVNAATFNSRDSATRQEGKRRKRAT